MKKIFIILFLMLSIFTVINAHPFKTEKELNNFFSKMDQLIKEELKKDYREEMSKRKGTADSEYTFEIEDDRTVLITRNIQGIKPETEITQYFNSEGKLYMISSLTKETEKDLYALYRKYDKNGNLSIYTYAIDGKNTDKGYYSDGKLAYIQELKIIIGQNPIPNGKYIEYYKNGQVKVQGNHKEGKRDGEFKAFLRNGKSAGSVVYKDGKIIKSTLVNSMKDNASFSLVTDIIYNLNSHEIVTDEFPNQLLKQYFIFNKNGLLDGESREYYEEGDIKSVSPFKNNVADGIFISYYQNGNIKEKHTYKNGNEEGEGLFYYENAKLEEKYFMKNGKLEGEATAYFEDGKIRNKSIFKDGVKLEEETYKDDEIRKNTFKNGEIVQQDIYSKNKKLKAKKFFLENGKTKIISYYENGNKQEEVFVINELFDGEALVYYPSGKLKEKDFFKKGKREGETIIYYENGNAKQKSTFKNDKREGDLFIYYPSGKLRQTEKFINGKAEGEVIEYYESGAIKEKAYFINDKQEKEHFFYDEKGNLTKTEIYKNGVKQ
ncbi:toxin-antitoxin system YwqK family antitoxin [Fusobacterium nucleatum]|uniref:toxin-antitoxin system YwqK family antitoxin n=1 Tax=Fusobacterium nucleatum TaxID=851 RepID=UPI000425056A|nr:toxin-antitoxin system YwqK family antitoxin [Fusobacterium nucleatum]ALF22979.1 phophatidylinositol-4-phosphate 5-kinase [Fusobacterium nucleatum subsp. nucleatum ChDC F316]ASG25843.1 phosphatidylinositol-4-phosphate 5-kinase [Fusobacterium nucleatum subsp. nucleatum]